MIDFSIAIKTISNNGGFRPNKHDTSYYRTYNVQGSKPLQVRVSNHGTWLWTWYDKNYNPSSAINYCIVFSEDGNYDSDVSVNMDIKDEQRNTIGQRKSFEVMQYVYNCQLLDVDDAAIINQNIQNIWQNKDFKDPFAGSPKHAKVVKLKPNEPIETIVENKQINCNRNMKQTIRLTENELRGMINEAVKKALQPTRTRRPMNENRNKTIRLTESELRGMIQQSVRKALNESKGKKKLQNSFKSKEDMTKYRDMYEPNSHRSIYDTDGSYYDSEETKRGAWGSGPFKDYSYHDFADGYDYCGDDDYNDHVTDYNHKLERRLATKGGQMSHDWEQMQKNFKEEDDWRRDYMLTLQKEKDNALQGIDNGHGNTPYWKKQWVNGFVDNDFLDDWERDCIKKRHRDSDLTTKEVNYDDEDD